MTQDRQGNYSVSKAHQEEARWITHDSQDYPRTASRGKHDGVRSVTLQLLMIPSGNRSFYGWIDAPRQGKLSERGRKHYEDHSGRFSGRMRRAEDDVD